MIKNILRNISNIPGWSSKRKIIVIESDDWGSIRMSSKESFHRLKLAGISVHKNHYNTNDGLESNQDMEMLMDVLLNHIDSSGRNPVITGLNIVANPDFEKIYENQFTRYEYESFTKTCQKYPHHDKVHDLWKKGIKQRLMVPLISWS